MASSTPVVSRALAPPPTNTDTWLALSSEPLPATVTTWAVTPGCGAVVTFTGTARDHAEGRPGVEELTYEAYESQAVARLGEVAAEARRRWPAVARVALLHRTGALAVGDVAVVVAVSAPHRAEAFEAARWCIDTVKQTVPIWKKERWAGGEAWGTDAQPLRAVADAPRHAAHTTGPVR